MTNTEYRRYPFEERRELSRVELATESLMKLTGATRVDGKSWLTYDGRIVDNPTRPLAIYEWAWNRSNAGPKMFVFEIQDHRNVLLLSTEGAAGWKVNMVPLSCPDNEFKCCAALPMPNVAGEMNFNPLRGSQKWQEPEMYEGHDVSWSVSLAQFVVVKNGVVLVKDRVVDRIPGQWEPYSWKEWEGFCKTFMGKVDSLGIEPKHDWGKVIRVNIKKLGEATSVTRLRLALESR